MELISFEFLFFCIISIFLYFIFPKKLKWFILLISSMFLLFYKNLSVFTVIQMLVILLTSYFGGLLIEKNEGKKSSKRIFVLSILLIVAELVLLKYNRLIIVPLNALFNLIGIDYVINFNVSNSLIGLSYYSLIMISYLADVYWKLIKPERNMLKCALFMSYFPILFSGPFIKYEKTRDSLYGGNKFNYHNLCYGFVKILWGCFKILIISQRLALFVSNVYQNINGDIGVGVYSILAILFFPIQLYANFSGTIDIITGVSKIIGIDLPKNFNAPFFATSITDFWRRWHITLGEWLKNYIFYPLLKSNAIQKLQTKINIKKFSVYISMLIMWTLIGIWHGGKMTFIIGSGVLQFVFMFFEDLLKPITDKIFPKIGIDKSKFSYKLFCIIRTYVLFAMAMVFFRSDSINQAIEMFRSIFVYNPWVLLDNNSIYLVGLDLLEFRILIIGVITLFIVDYLSTKGDVIEMLFSQNLVFRWMIIYILFFFIIVYGWYGPEYNPADFIYSNF